MDPVGHQIPTKVNVDRENGSTKNNLYQHHDIMLGGPEFNDAFGIIPAKSQVDDDKAGLIAKSQVDDDEAELIAKPASMKQDPEPQVTAGEWKRRVYPESQWARTTVFDISGVDPKQSASRPSWTGDPEGGQPCQKPLRKREISRIGPDGKVTRSYRRPGSVN